MSAAVILIDAGPGRSQERVASYFSSGVPVRVSGHSEHTWQEMKVSLILQAFLRCQC
jgi:hypothetical protein